MATTITKAAEMYIESLKGRVGLKGRFGRQAVTVNTMAYDVMRAITPIAGRDICSLKRSDVEVLCGHWMGQELAPRTAHKYVLAFKGLLDYADAEIECYVQPKGLTKLFDECRPDPKEMRSKPISEFDGVALAKVMAVANDQLKLCILLALNAGQYQQDVSDLKPTDVQGDHLVWTRSKTDHQSNLVLHHWLFPETRSLIEKCRSTQNGFGRLLTTTHGTPLVTRTVGQRDSDSISQAWHRACKAAEVSLSFRDLRKWSASAIARISDMDTQRMFRGEVIQGSSAAYVLQAFDQKLTPALQAWHQELQTLLQPIA